MIKLKIDCKKISKEDLYEGKKGTYLDAVLMNNKDGRDQYGNDGFIVQDLGKERRLAGEKGPIIGNWSDTGAQAAGAPAAAARPQASQQAAPQASAGPGGLPF